MSSQKFPPFTSADFTFVVASTIAEADSFMQAITTSTVATDTIFGFDVELTPTRAVRLIQIATRTQAYVFDITLIGTFPTSLLDFVANAKYTKIGVDILGDAKTLPQASMRSGGDLSRLHRTIDHLGAHLGLHFASSVALASLSEQWIGRTLDKTLQKFDWSQDLQTHHYTYAAADAAVAIRIYDAILQRHASMAVPNPFWTFVDIDPLSGKAVGLYDEYPPYSAKNSAHVKNIQACLNKIQKAINLADATNKVTSGKTWSEIENPAMVVFCADLTQALARYHRTVAAYSQ
ncbi:hypothetical protein PC9H_009181 [Pleurotus ostreatus]|uniref:3'-5' exonuclease domain-containing protein n=1 Tax=Pleurotus ostreatus TaxID=5322 RepID=A0A8H6ZSD6_PLEOS|nr:uncharacterized protein PC9H_009096 [Pleurotus ostreatus]XP_036630116.1 uncharacterized protein PC9H_009181 [Pleurotus ostreatus]KAF7426727.1 hypothetical protein PC9H_009096 [Pleurotus ostreatus]KAF7426812.1 hypothetical protein PC9H_009181 [Pleurotus ostreatus]KAJ8694330.1 hypothetical protein PTI98_009254 [Pleurotus ostreatus]